jgi:hypothetical protein
MQKFEEWPPRSWDSLPLPSTVGPEVLSYAKSRLVAYFQSKKFAAGA